MATNTSRLDRSLWRGGRGSGWPSSPQRVLFAVVTCLRMALTTLRHAALQDGIYLVPVRVFIGIGWLRAFAEKVIEPGWRNGSRLATFLEHQHQSGLVVFPPYEALLTGAFLPHALALGWIIMLGQMLAGLAIVSGSLTTVALLGGIFMNLNFLLAGAPDPSTFYIVIQAVLVVAGAGAILGVDARLAAHPRRCQPSPPIATSTSVALAMLALGCAVYASLHIRDWTPGGSVRDPAAVLAVLALMTASWVLIAALRGDHRVSTERGIR